MAIFSLPSWLRCLLPSPDTTPEQIRAELFAEADRLVIEIAQLEIYGFQVEENAKTLDTLFFRLIGIAYQLFGQQIFKNPGHLLDLAGLDGAKICSLVQKKWQRLLAVWVERRQPNTLNSDVFAAYHSMYVFLAIKAGHDDIQAQCDSHRLLERRAYELRREFHRIADNQCSCLLEQIKFLH